MPPGSGDCCTVSTAGQVFAEALQHARYLGAMPQSPHVNELQGYGANTCAASEVLQADENASNPPNSFLSPPSHPLAVLTFEYPQRGTVWARHEEIWLSISLQFHSTCSCTDSIALLSLVADSRTCTVLRCSSDTDQQLRCKLVWTHFPRPRLSLAILI